MEGKVPTYLMDKEVNQSQANVDLFDKLSKLEHFNNPTLCHKSSLTHDH